MPVPPDDILRRMFDGMTDDRLRAELAAAQPLPLTGRSRPFPDWQTISRRAPVSRGGLPQYPMTWTGRAAEEYFFVPVSMRVARALRPETRSPAPAPEYTSDDYVEGE